MLSDVAKTVKEYSFLIQDFTVQHASKEPVVNPSVHQIEQNREEEKNDAGNSIDVDFG